MCNQNNTLLDNGVYVHTEGCCASVQLTNTSMRFANKSIGFKQVGDNVYNARIQIDSCQFIGSYAVTYIVYLEQVNAKITNSIFSNNTSDANGGSVITLHNIMVTIYPIVHSCNISENNNMTGITLIDTSAVFSGYNVIKITETQRELVSHFTAQTTFMFKVSCFCTTTLLINMVEQFL